MSGRDTAGERGGSGFAILLAAAHGILLVLLVTGVLGWQPVILAMVALHLLVVYGSLWPRSRLLGPNLLRVAPADHAGRRVYLTFDDGPDAQVTPRVLDLLGRDDARATFFVVGKRAGMEPALVRRMADGGHGLENHSQGHLKRFSLLSPWRMAREIDDAQETVRRLTGRAPSYFRSPAGLRSPWLAPLLARRGLRLVTWTRRGFDAASGDPERVLARLTRDLRAGDILVLHDGGAARAADGQPVVCHVLPRLLDEIRRLGLRPAPLPASGSAAP